MLRGPAILSATAIALLMSGCQSAARHQLAAISSFEKGDIQTAMTSLDEAAECRGAEAELLAADQAILSLMAGDARSCEKSLQRVRNRLQYFDQQDLSEDAAAMLSDEAATAWTGREFERRMIDNLLVISSLVGDRQDAIAWSNQNMEQVYEIRRDLKPADESGADSRQAENQSAASREPGARHEANALAAYLHASLNSESPLNSDLTDRSIREVSFWQADGPDSGVSPLLTARLGTQSEKQHGTLHVITFNGRVTDWGSEVVAPGSAALLLADQILSATGDHTLPPTVSPVTIAKPRTPVSRFPAVTTVRVGAEVARSRTLVDLNAAAWDSWEADRDRRIARAVVRRVIKKGTIYAAKDQLAVGKDSGADLLLNVGGMIWEAVEKPDTRHLSMLPERVDSVQVELPVGEHEVILASDSRGAGRTGDSVTVSVQIEDGRNTFVLCFCPSLRSGLRVVAP